MSKRTRKNFSAEINPHRVLDSARSFLIGADRLGEGRPLPNGAVQRLMIPMIASLAFSIELSIKSILLADGRAGWGHELSPLFNELPELAKREVVVEMGSNDLEFFSRLKQASNAFEEWRYVFEHGAIGADIGFLQQLANILVRTADSFLRQKGIERHN
nr:hypothetical protein [uncultured Acidovorax sp.]